MHFIYQISTLEKQIIINPYFCKQDIPVSQLMSLVINSLKSIEEPINIYNYGSTDHLTYDKKPDLKNCQNYFDCITYYSIEEWPLIQHIRVIKRSLKNKGLFIIWHPIKNIADILDILFVYRFKVIKMTEYNHFIEIFSQCKKII